MHPYVVYTLIAILVALCLKSFFQVVVRQYLEDFFNDPTGGIVPIEDKKSVKPQDKK